MQQGAESEPVQASLSEFARLMVLRLLSSVPSLTWRTGRSSVGQKILYAFDDEHYGWYIGTIAGTGLAARDLKQTPRANCVVSYKRKETMVASLFGKVACELSKHLYGVDQWWVLLKKKA